MKRITLIVVLAFLSVGGSLWVSQNYLVQWEPALRAQLEARISRALKVRIHIDHIAISFLHRISLRDIQVWDTQTSPETPLFRAKEVALTASLIDLPRALYHRNPLEIVGLITVDTPFLTLSPEAIRTRQFNNPSGKKATPLWFAVEWSNGTVQWKDPQAIHGAWTLYQAEGFFRIRGPRMDGSLRGGVEQARSLDLRLRSFGKRWTLQGRVFHGNLQQTLEVVQHAIKKPILPAAWKADGDYDFEVLLGGRWPLPKSVKLGGLVREAHLKWLNASIHPSPTEPPLYLDGGLTLENNRLNLSALSFRKGNHTLKLGGFATPFADVPEIDLQLYGQLGPLPIETHTRILRLHNRWDITPTAIPVLNGTLTLKGSVAPEQLNLALTGTDLLLDRAEVFQSTDALRGRLNFSLTAQGPLDDWRMAGSFWVNAFSWVNVREDTLKGGLELTPNHLDLHGASDDGGVRVQIAGTRSAKSLSLQQALIQLRPSTTISAHGTYGLVSQKSAFTVEAKNISLADDVPHATWLKGHASLDGTLESGKKGLEFNASLKSPDFQMGSLEPSKANATLHWTSDALLVDASFGKETSVQGEVKAALRGQHLEISRLSLISPYAKTELKGNAGWDKSADGKRPAKIVYGGEGRVFSVQETAPWNAAYRFKGELEPAAHWKGTLHIEAPTIQVYAKASEPFETDLNWDASALHWVGLRWGKSFISNGSIQFKDHAEALAGELKAQDLDMARWQALFWPQGKEAVHGILTGGFTLSGQLEDPSLQFSATIRNGIWRAFHFETNAKGRWSKNGLDPITLEGALATGGQFHFQGRVSATDHMASGSLDLVQLELKPIGESLAFTHPVESKASGTLTVSGPLNQLRFAGHIEGGALIYGGETANPLRLQSYVMDLKLEPLLDATNTTRLIVTQALVKTQEEQIRLNPGSFIDFAPNRESHLQIGTEIRNLHLGVFTLFGGLDINGTWQVRPQGFAIQGELFTRSLFINDYQLEQGSVQASYYDRVLSFQPLAGGSSLVTGTVDFRKTPQLTFKDFAVTGRNHESLKLSGTFGPQNWNFDMQGTGLDLNTLGGLSGFPYPLEGSANVKIHGAGDLEHPHVEGTLDVRDGRALGLTFQNGAATFAWQGQRMTFTRLQLSDPGRYNLTGTGVFPLSANVQKGGDKTIDFSLRLTDSNLGLLQSITSEVKSAQGAVQALVQIKGTSDAPLLKGSFRVKNGDVNGAHYFKHVRDFQFAADFDGDTLIISEFSGKSGKGQFVGGGRVSFTGFEPKSYDLHVEVPSLKGIEVTIPELAIPESPLAKKLHFLTLASQGDVKGKVSFQGPANAPVFFGKANISNGHFTFPPSRKNPPPAAFMEWVRRIRWDVDLGFSDDAWFENEMAEANLIGGLSIKGTSDKLKVNGGMDITEGKISYLGIEFDIRQARFDIRSNETESTIVTTPYVRGLAESHVQTVDAISGQGVTDTITLTINYAPVNEIKPQLRSSLDPNLTQEKVLNRATQLEVEKLNPQERNALYQQQMVRILDTSLATPLARSLLKKTGLVDELHVSRVINPAANSLTTDPSNPSAGQQDSAVNFLAGTKYTVAKNLSSRLSLGYGVRFEQITNSDLTNKLDLRSDVEMSYRFISNIYLRGSFDLPSQTPGSLPDRKVTIEPHWRFGWWGNTNKPRPKSAKPTAPASSAPQETNPTPAASH